MNDLFPKLNLSQVPNLSNFSLSLGNCAKRHATAEHERRIVTVYHAIGNQTKLSDLMKNGIKNRRLVVQDGLLPAARVHKASDIWRESIVYAGLKQPNQSFSHVEFRVQAGQVQVGNQSLASGLYSVSPEYLESVMPLSEYLARMEIPYSGCRHPATALPLPSTDIQSTQEKFGLLGYSPEVLIENRTIPPSEFISVNRGK